MNATTPTPAPAAPPPPATPPPAPVKPDPVKTAPAPAKAAPPPPTPPKPPTRIQNAYDELEKLAQPPDKTKEPDKPKPDQTKAETPKATDDVDPPVDETYPPDKPADTKPDPDLPAEKMAPKALREAYTAAKLRVKELEAKAKDFEAKINPDADTHVKTLQEKLAAKEKRLAEIEKDLETTAFERSDVFKNQYEKPFHSAWNLGRAYVAQLKVTDPQTGEIRQGTSQDFDALMSMSDRDPDRAAEMADQLFGSKTAMVAPYIARVNESLASMQEVLKDRRETGSAKEKERSEAMTKQREEVETHLKSAWNKHQAGAVEKYPQWFKPIAGDEEGNALLKKGFEQSARAFSSLNSASDPSLTAEDREQVIASHAAVFNKAAAFPRLVHQLKAKEAELAKLQAELKAYQDSGPGVADGGGKNNNGRQIPNWESALEALAR